MLELLSHHALLLETEPQDAVAKVTSALERAKITVAGNPDVLILEHETLGIDEVREIISRASARALMPSGKWFIISFLSVTREAQNALLKTIEEPTADTHFVLITPDASRILPTLRSRLHIVKGESAESSKEVEQFLKNPIPTRLTQLAPMIKDKDRARAISFLRELEGAAGEKGFATSDPDFVHDLIRFRDYLADRGSSVKIILEYIAHAAPRA